MEIQITQRMMIKMEKRKKRVLKVKQKRRKTKQISD
jgi:hypothetical protein